MEIGGWCFVAGATFRKSNKWLQKEGEGNIETNPALLFPTTCVSCPTAKTTCWVINIVLHFKLFRTNYVESVHFCDKS